MDKSTEDEMERRLRQTFDKRVPEGWFDWRGLQTNGTFFEQSSTPSSPFNCLFVNEAQKQNCVEHLCKGEEEQHAPRAEGKEASEGGDGKRDVDHDDDVDNDGNDDNDNDNDNEDEDEDDDEDESESDDSDDNAHGLQDDFRQKVLNNRRHQQLQLQRQAAEQREDAS